MKTFALLLLIPATVIAGLVEDSQRIALKVYPDLGTPGSEMNRAFVSEVNLAKSANAPVLQNANWPLILAKKAAIAVGAEKPVTEQVAPAAKPTPWIPQSTALAIPKDGKAGGARHSESQSVIGRVFQRTKAGIMVDCEDIGEKKDTSIGKKKVRGTVMVTNFDASLDTVIKVAAIPDGTYEYTTVDGAEQMVDVYRVP